MNEIQQYLQTQSEGQRLEVLRAAFALECARELARRSGSLMRNEPIDDALKAIAEADPNGD